jgi:hypothetical protein
MDRVFGESRYERETQLDSGLPLERVHLPAAIEELAGGQRDGVRGMNFSLVRLTDKVDHVGNRVRADLGEDVGGFAQHPGIERAEDGLRQRAVPGNGDVVDGAEHPALHIVAQLLVDLREEEVVADAEAQSPRGGELDQRVARVGGVAHRLFQKYRDTGLKHGAGRLVVSIGRGQDVDGVQLAGCALGGQHLVQRGKDSEAAIFVGQRLRLGDSAIADSHQLDAGDGLEGLGVPVCNIAGAE